MINNNTIKNISTAIILAGGLGQRMKSGNFPKSLIPIESINILSEHLLQLKKLEIEKIFISVNKDNLTLKNYLNNFSNISLFDIKIIEEDVCGSGGSLQNILKKTGFNDFFICISVDSYFDFDYNILIQNFVSDTFLVFKKYKEGRYCKDENFNSNNLFCLAKENKEKFCYSGIGIFDAKLLNKFSFNEKEFDLCEYLIEIAKLKKLKGIEAYFPLFNLNSYNDVLNINKFFSSRKIFINKFCIKGIKSFLFDLDFTLIDPSNIVIDGINFACEKLNIRKLTKEEIYSKTKYILPRDKVIHFSKELIPEKSEEFVKLYYEYITDKKPVLYPGTMSLLYFLHSQGYILGIVTLKSRKLTDNLLNQFKIKNLFKTVITYDEVSKKKPDPEGLITAVKNIGLNKEDCIYIGDDINDAKAAQNCNMNFIGVITGKTIKEEFYEINEYNIYDNLYQIENKLRQLSLLYQYSQRYPKGVKDMVITSEKIHPDTKNLSYLILKDPIKGINCLLAADILSLENILKIKDKVESLSKICHEVINKGNKIHLFGCGSSGRLIVLLERIMIKENNNLRFSITFNASGLDTIIPKSFADFEDNPNFGIKQLLHVNYSQNDLVITISGSGTAPFLLEILSYVAQNGNINPIHIFCNTVEELSKRCSENKIFRDKNIKTKINFFSIPCGPMSITGSTRLQATLVLTIVLGCALFKYNYEEIVFNLIEILKKLNLSPISDLAKYESDIYKKGEKIIYKTDPDHAFIAMMDTTERTATFNLSPFKNNNDISGLNSLCYLNIINTKNSSEALFNIFLREPNLLEWEEYPRTSKEYFLGYDFSKYDKDIYKYCLNIYNDGIHLVFKNEIEEIRFDIPLNNELQYQMIYKTIINIYSNIVMGLMKYFEGNVMSNVTASNTKLIGRICYLVEGITDFDNYNLIRDIVFQEVLNLSVNQSIIKNCVNKLKIIHFIQKFEKENNILPKFKLIRYLYENEIRYKKIEKIEEGYGNREYFRIFQNDKSFIIVFYPDEKSCNDFIYISEILQKNKINIQNFSKKENNMIILEDLGTEHFKSENYKEIIEIIISLQNIDYKNIKIDLYPEELIYEEMKGFLDNFLIKLLNIKLEKTEEKYILDLCSAISNKLFNSKNKCFVHKDMNPSNILFRNNKFYLIDYQNALIGSCYYDLVCLLFNERELLSQEQIYHAIKLYLEKSKFKNDFEIEFSFCVFHRLLKTLGCFGNLYLITKDEILLTYIKNCLDIAIWFAEIKQFYNLKNIIENAKVKFYNKYFEKKEESKYCRYNCDLNLELIKVMTNKKFFIVTGTSSSGKTTLVKKYENKFDCLIIFDELLKETIEEHIKKTNPEEYSFLQKYFRKDIWYFIRHSKVKDNPFISYYISSLTEKIKEIINQNILKINTNLLTQLEYRTKTWDKLISLIKTQSDKGKTILLDIAYLKEEEYYKLKNINNNYCPVVILNYINLKNMAKIIKRRNLSSLDQHLCTEYRHIILNIYMYLQYYESKNINEKPDFIVTEEEINLIIKEIPQIDPYADTYHWEKFRKVEVLKEFNFPIKLKFPNFPSIKNIINIDNIYF